jgi:cbb3-type cytochrome oxidase subunit 3
MSPVWGYVAGGVTLALLLIFIATWMWAWGARQQAAFDRMARLPLEDD